MPSSYFLDTHVVVFLYQGQIEKFSAPVKGIIDSQDLFISPIVKLELTYLHEIKRINKTSTSILEALKKDIGLVIHNIPLNILIEESLDLTWTRDPFDRLIVAHAQAEDSFLLTKDLFISKYYKKSMW